jgi:drug/metabolite transporter (DMT)-like permease
LTEIPLGTSGPPRQGFGIGIVLLAGVFIGLLPNAAKIAYQEGANPLAVLTIRCVLGTMGLGIYLAVSGGRFKIGWPAFRFNAVTGAAHALAAVGIMGAVAYIDVSLAILIVFLHPFFIAIVEHFRGRSRLTPALVACIAVAVVGLGLALAVKLDALDPTGIALALTGAVAATAMVLFIVRATKQVGAVTANFYMTVWASLYFILVAIFGPALGLIDSMAFPVSLKGWIAILGTGVTFTFGYTLFFVGAAIIGATRAAMISILEPVLTILFAILLVQEWLTAIQWLGVALVVASLLVMEKPRKVR